MPEYRRFIAYFYEYINGKKQKNAGFAKVELRNGMWRLLFRLTTNIIPEAPIQVYGFVREQGYLLGFPIGVMRSGKEIVEEWAYRADAPIGKERYHLADFAGIWIQSADGRCFITVWDDEVLNPEKFVLELPEEPAPERGQTKEETSAAQPEIQADAVEQADINIEEKETALQQNQIPPISEDKYAELSHLFEKRKAFSPFQDEEIGSCVQIMPCDIAWLQQHSWKVGRSSFLQHGFYQYRHLLLGKMEGETCVIGVPGIRNPQEQYMAELFGYDQFKLSRICECGKAFGYWYRPLTKQ